MLFCHVLCVLHLPMFNHPATRGWWPYSHACLSFPCLCLYYSLCLENSSCFHHLGWCGQINLIFYSKRQYLLPWILKGRAFVWMSHRAGVPNPPGRGPVPVRNQAAQQEVSGGRVSKASSAAPRHSHYSLDHPPHTPRPGPWKNCLPRSQSLVPKRLGTAVIENSPFYISCPVWTPMRQSLFSLLNAKAVHYGSC